MKQSQSHDEVMASYGLCLFRDAFVRDRCGWVVDLQDGTKVFQDDDRPGQPAVSAWVRLGHYIGDYPQNNIAQMRLRFHTHIIGLPPDKPFYFYSKGMQQSMTQTHGLNFHIVGWPEKNKDDILCVWYKTPELVETKRAHRKISVCRPQQLVGLTKPIANV